MDQRQTPLLDALSRAESHPYTGFGAPGHGHGARPAHGMRRLTGSKTYKADLLTTKGIDDRMESGGAVDRAEALAADAWGADLCRFGTGGSTQSVHAVLSAVARAGDTVLIAQNAHKAEWSHVIAADLDAVPLPVQIDHDYDMETVVAPETLEAALAAHPHAKAVVVVSPNYYGITCDIAALSRIAHAHGVPLIVDAAWGGAFAFSSRLPADALALGADVQLCSIHKTMTALGQGSVILARKSGLVDLQRLLLAHSLFQSTSSSVPILASLDASRRDHATGGEKIWDKTLDLAEDARKRIARVPGLRVWERDRLPPGSELDPSAILIDMTELGCAGYAADAWLEENHHVAMGMAEARHVLALILPGVSSHQVSKLVHALSDLSDHVRRDPALLPRADTIPPIGAVTFDRALSPTDAFFAQTEEVAYEDCAGRVAAEIIAPAPPGIPRVMPGLRISPAHRDWLVASRDAGMFVLDPADPAERRLRVVAGDPAADDRPLMFAAER